VGADDESAVMPKIAPGVPVRFLDVAAPWSGPKLGAVVGGRRLQAAIAVRVDLLYDDTKSALRHTEQIEAILAPLDGPQIDPARAIGVDYDDRDFVEIQPPNTVFVLPSAPVDTKTYFTGIEASVKDYLYRSRHTTILTNPGLKLYSRPGESQEQFAAT
jgi:hypothetical protein